ncbi:hypothetical protein T11_7573 [Trichinella zimbabwensis]|uniref:Uncharacterized protein n=1 Tax=Trichinella zimbabwensis TaxID=268475 RepID=A0A0V1H960_9BILA|nr:hypothetical protein T11_7573 [Trichinella zimbabwensis]
MDNTEARARAVLLKAALKMPRPLFIPAVNVMALDLLLLVSLLFRTPFNVQQEMSQLLLRCTVKLTELSLVALFDLSLWGIEGKRLLSFSILVVFHYFPVSVADRISTTTTGNRSNRLQDVPCHRRVKDAVVYFTHPPPLFCISKN